MEPLRFKTKMGVEITVTPLEDEPARALLFTPVRTLASMRRETVELLRDYFTEWLNETATQEVTTK